MSKIQDKPSNIWYLVQWVGSFPENAFDIINSSDVVHENNEEKENITVGSSVMVRCGKIKSPAHIIQISKNTDALYNELKRLQRKILTENTVTNVLYVKQSPENPKVKKRKYSSINNQMKCREAATQTDENITKILEENRKLKAELYEANKLINVMCKDLNVIVQTAQKKILNIEPDVDDDASSAENSNLKKSTNNVIEESDKVLIGTNKTPIPRYIYNTVNWCSFTHATRKLLMAVFTRDILATHSLTGKPSPAFMGADMPVKMKLDADKVADIVEIVSLKCNVSETMVRSAITTKLADENKMYRRRKAKEETKK